MGEIEYFTDKHGVSVGFCRWMPTGSARGIVCIAHGASEYGARYDRFAKFLTANGLAVFAHDHRGHGHTAKATGVGIVGPGGWDGILEDQHELVQLARAAVPGVKLVLFAHSMGSFIGQAYIQRYSDEIDGVVLSGSSGGTGAEDTKGTLELLDAIIADGDADSPAPTFAAFNVQFEPARTTFDWLSRDPDEVDKYIADPLCGDDMPLTLGFVREMVASLGNAAEGEDRIRKDLPVLFITGEMDPVSQNASTVHLLEQRYRDKGITDVAALYYPEARHELLNETNRDDVQADVLAWINRVT
ncbi:MAG: hypothetical protein QOI61_14 [Actinomycetota bacterium]